ncbi:MAG: 2Fe-2S iron-sulfur cluster binding domain-containing protein [bacterium]|nr:2Fe-2S iron-sulfur cluster binding domain-containing protein [bacterium]
MTEIIYHDAVYPLQPDETVLDALLRNGVDVPYACKTGVCQSCMMKAAAGEPPSSSQRGLKPTRRAQGYFLACQCKPDGRLIVGDAGEVIAARLMEKTPLNARVIRLRFEPESRVDWAAGQFVSLIRGDGESRSYSIASAPVRDGFIEMHVQRVEGGAISPWLHEEAEPGERIRLRGPYGDCFYLSGEPERPLLLACTGTGLAPIYGVLRDALALGHSGPIHLLHGGLDESGLYLVDELLDLAGRYSNLSYTRCVLNGASKPGLVVGDIGELLLQTAPSFSGWRVYLCGAPDLVRLMQKKVFLHGATSQDIHADAFIPKQV